MVIWVRAIGEDVCEYERMIMVFLIEGERNAKDTR